MFYTDDIDSRGNAKFGDYGYLISTPELEVNDTTDDSITPSNRQLVSDEKYKLVILTTTDITSISLLRHPDYICSSSTWILSIGIYNSWCYISELLLQLRFFI